jgi:diacylglycerol kinase family enzyme
MDRLVVIANPAASQFTGGSHRAVMSALSKEFEVDAVWPRSATETAEQATAAVENGVGIVAAMGGDGMVHHVAQGLVGTESSLAVIPVGTTNVLARILKIPSKPVKAAKLITSNSDPVVLGVAALTLNRGATSTSHSAMFSCGLGLDAAVVIAADKEPYRKYRFGSLHYARSAFGVGLKDFPKRAPHVVVKAGEEEANVTSALVQFREIYTYFGKRALRLTPEPPDPMTVLTLETMKRRRIPQITLDTLRGRDLANVEEIQTWSEVDELTFEADPAVELQADGEALGLAESGAVKWVPDALKVIAGQPSP